MCISRQAVPGEPGQGTGHRIVHCKNVVPEQESKGKKEPAVPNHSGTTEPPSLLAEILVAEHIVTVSFSLMHEVI